MGGVLNREFVTIGLTPYYKASLSCFQNAETFIADAKALIRRGSNGHAVALLVLAEEELGKSILWGMKVLGIDVPELVLRSHSAKQLLKVTLFDLMDVLPIFDMLEAVRKIFREPDLARRAQKAQQFQKRLKHRLDTMDKDAFKQSLDEELERLDKMEERKEAGMYVDVLPGGKVISPTDVTKEEATKHLRLVERRHRRFLRILGPVLTGEATEEQLAEISRQWEGNRKVSDEKVAEFLSMLEKVARKGL